jgi:hypothetical protein
MDPIGPLVDLGGNWRHAGMRHVRVDVHGCSPHEPPPAVPQRDFAHRRGASDRRRGLQVPLNTYVVGNGRLARACTGHETAGEKDGKQRASNGGGMLRSQTDAARWRCHAHVHWIFVSRDNGNMWKYIATTIGMNTMVL